MLYQLFIKPLLNQLNTEYVHEMTIKVLHKMTDPPWVWLIRQRVAVKPVTCMGLNFKNPVGLAAGVDSNGDAIAAFAAMGFAFIEVGTVTPKAQPGSAKPRFFKIKEADAFISRTGWPNLGVDYLVQRLKVTQYDGIIGVNIGKNSDTPLEQAQEDYLCCIQKVYPYAGYITLNTSLFSTLSLCSLQNKAILENLLKSSKEQQTILTKQYDRYVPITIKVEPDLNEEEIEHVADCVLRYNIDGIVSTNPTLQHQLIRGLSYCNEIGGLSGRPLQQRSTSTVRSLTKALQGKVPIIGVGGIDSLVAAREKLNAGASLIQIHSALFYHGPTLIKKIIEHI